MNDYLSGIVCPLEKLEDPFLCLSSPMCGVGTIYLFLLPYFLELFRFVPRGRYTSFAISIQTHCREILYVLFMSVV